MTNHFDQRGRLPQLGLGLLVLLLTSTDAAHAQLRIVTYNTSTGHNNASGQGIKTARPDMDIVLEAIGEETVNGIRRPIDVLLLQEQYTMSQSAGSFVTLLNGIYGTVDNPTPYARGVVNGQTSEPNGDAGRPGIVYNTTTVQLVAGVGPGEASEAAFGSVNGTNQARSTLRYRIQPVGYDDTAVFYAYNDHYKAGSASADQTRRNIEATNIRTNATYGSNSLGEGAHAIFAGDYNMQSSSEAAFQTLIAAGAGQANDPINRLGSWNNNASFADIHTQAPCDTGSPCASDFTPGGMDDRFDFQLVTGEFLNGEGLSYISGTYHTFGNNGTTFESDITNVSNTYPFDGVTTYTQDEILDALWNASDHLPVVADYQLPAVMHAAGGTVPLTLNQGDMFNLDVTVSNVIDSDMVPVDFANGADELDYSLSIMNTIDNIGSLIGPANGTDQALGGVNTHFVTLNTSTTGMKTGTITVSSTSESVQNGLINIPISFVVILAGDYNDDDKVDAADYVLWRKNEGTMNVLPNDPFGGMIGANQYATWRENFGMMESGGGGLAGGAVPEPSAAWLLLWGVCWAYLSRGTLRG